MNFESMPNQEDKIRAQQLKEKVKEEREGAGKEAVKTYLEKNPKATMEEVTKVRKEAGDKAEKDFWASWEEGAREKGIKGLEEYAEKYSQMDEVERKAELEKIREEIEKME
jgi:hypothetical protein